MHTNHSIGYNTYMKDNIPIFGTWDDHDYGGNDRGNDMPQRMERAQLFYDFLRQSIPRDEDITNNRHHTDGRLSEPKEREGIYYSVEFRKTNPTSAIRILFLDTRYHRTAHCLPSLAGQFPLGAGIACLSRWFAAGMLQHYCTQQQQHEQNTILGTKQWEWLHQQIYTLPPPDVLIVVSSIQVYTTNPAMEGWGHFPKELQQLSELLLYASRRSVVTVLSGDVHHGEILQPFSPHHLSQSHTDTNDVAESVSVPPPPYYLEVTSSGLTHDCSKHIYGIVCEPLLRTFHQHRYPDINNYYIGKNYGTISIDWLNQNVSVNVHDAITGTVQLSTGSRPFVQKSNSLLSSSTGTTTTHDETMDAALLLQSILPLMDNHLVPYVYSGCILLVLTTLSILLYVGRTSTRSQTLLDKNNKNGKEKKS